MYFFSFVVQIYNQTDAKRLHGGSSARFPLAVLFQQRYQPRDLQLYER